MNMPESDGQKPDANGDWLEQLRRLDWKNSEKDFLELCDGVIGLLGRRDGLSSEKLFKILPEQDFRHEVRIAADRAEGRKIPLAYIVGYIYLRMKIIILPGALKRRRKIKDVKENG
jgi:hypothetical protein